MEQLLEKSMETTIPDTNKQTRRIKILGFPVDIVDFQQARQIATEAMIDQKLFHIVTLNPEMIIQGQKNPELKNSIFNADLNIPDGVGLLLAMKLNGLSLSQTVPGIELSEECLKFAEQNKLPVALLGSKQETLDQLLLKFKEKYPSLNIVYAQNGYFSVEEENSILQELQNKKPKLLLVALGVPKQETWIHANKTKLKNCLVIGVGGSFDVWSGRVKRAPKFFRNYKLEWFYRLISEPFRAKRIFSALPYFTFQVILEKMKKLVY
jgi:N-acetylglucosaminyldiphosphoundecaprenol N-acetyl-beta-D-mannosaminyltransferase